MKKKLAATIAALTLAVGLSACGHNNDRDIENVQNRQPDYIRNVENMDGQPNISFICFNGVPMVTTKRSGAGALHVISIPATVKLCESKMVGVGK